MLTHLLRLALAREIRPFIFKGGICEEINYEQKNAGIYVHIPFCKELCSFCPYYKVKYNKKLAEPYFDALIKEIEIVGKKFKNRQEVESVYFGGGSPALAGSNLSRIMDSIKEYFEIKGNCGIELHPGNINDPALKEIKKAGFDMVSIGIQSFQDKCLNALGREKMEIPSIMKLINSQGFKAVDIDLIFGIPGQDRLDLEKDFAAAVENGATQISTYPFIDFSYAHNPQRPQGRREKKLMLDTLDEISKKMGFIRNSVWTFVKRNTPRYSSITRDNFIGFGPSATTLTRECFKINTFSVEEYIDKIESNKIPTALTLKFNERTRALYWLFWSCYNMTIDKENFKDIFEHELEQSLGFELKLAKTLKLVEENETGYKLSKKGAYYFHLVEQKYTHQYIDKTWRIAGKDPWPEEIALY